VQSRPRLQLRIRSSAKSSKLQRQKILHDGLRCATLALHLKVRSKLGSGAKPATPKNVLHSIPLHAHNSASAAPQNQANASQKKLHGGMRCAKWGLHLKPAPRLQLRFASQHRKIKQIASPKNLRGGLRGAKWGWHIKHLRKINCTSQKALAEKAAWWVAMCEAGLHLKYKSCT